MRRLSAWTVVAVLFAASCLVVSAPQAHAADDAITSMMVHYDIQADGTVLVTHEVDWRFGSGGRHGIDFSIVTREPWDADETKDVVYDVSDIKVHSPSGAPDEFTERVAGFGSDETVDLRIGDPDVTVQGRKASYVISYALEGALRKFDGAPEFFWDVTSRDNPEIEEFEVRVTAPKGVAKARCLVGSSECDAVVSAQGAVLTGKNIEQGEVLSVVAELPSDSVEGAEPRLEDRKLSTEELHKVVSVVEVQPSGVLHVEQEFTYRLPADYATNKSSVLLDIPVRRPFSAEQDRLFEITNVHLEGDGDVEVLGPDTHSLDRSSQDMSVRINFHQEREIAVVMLSYDVAGAVVTGNDSSWASWVVTSVGLYDDPVLDYIWTSPTPIRQALCSRIGQSSEPEPCELDLVIEGQAVRWNPGPDRVSVSPWAWVAAEVEPLAGPGAQPILEPSLDAAARRIERLTFVGAIAAALVFAAGTMAAGTVVLRRNIRWADVPPGVMARTGARTRPTTRGDIVPVRFHEPEASLWQAGLVWDQRSDSRHTVAALVQLAAMGAIELRASPLEVNRRGEVDVDDALQMDLCEIADSDSAAPVLLRRMNQAVADEQEQLLKNRAMFQEPKPSVGLRRFLVWLPVLISVVILALDEAFGLEWFGPHGEWVIAAAAMGAFAAGFFARRMRIRTPLAPAGTALRDQIEGFRTYIATAEANQLNVEAEADVYRRYLPWAVLFDLIEHWSKVCQELADAGRIPPLDTSYLPGSSSPIDVAAGLASFADNVPRAQSSSTLASLSVFSDGGGGSGGSSGFSDSSSGGGGGGGTSSSSW